MFGFRFLSILFASVMLLTACADQATRCTGPETRELKTIDRLIAETRTNIDRGYRMERRDSDANFNFCLGSRRSNVGISYCTAPGSQTRATALDTASETRKLDGLLARRAALLTEISQKQAACSVQG